MLDKIRTVLIHNTHPGNIGSAARALKNMGLSQLYLVAPKEFPSEVANKRASGAEDLLEKAVVVDTLPEALQGVHAVYGTSGRNRSLEWPVMSARAAAEHMIHEHMISEKEKEFAILFGCETHGLTNDQLHYCQAQIEIPANPLYASLNVAQAVQIISYEFRMAVLQCDTLSRSRERVAVRPGEGARPDGDETPTFDDLQGFYHHLEQTLVDIHFLDREKPGQMMPRLRRLFSRASPDKIELNILRGILTAIQKQV